MTLSVVSEPKVNHIESKIFILLIGNEKVQVGKDQEKEQSEKDFHSKTELEKTKLTIRYLYHENIS